MRYLPSFTVINRVVEIDIDLDFIIDLFVTDLSVRDTKRGQKTWVYFAPKTKENARLQDLIR